MKKLCSHKLVSSFILASLSGCGGGDDDVVCDFTSVNTAPVFTTDNVILWQENQTTEVKISAFDADGDRLSFDINGNEDGGQFTNGSALFNAEYLIGIDRVAGVVTFNEAPDYENPVDTNDDNIYKLHVTVDDNNFCNTDRALGAATEIFQIKIINDPTDDETWSWWDGNLIKNNDYEPYDKHLTSYGLIVAGLPDVTEDFMKKIGNIVNAILRRNSLTSDPDRNSLLGNIVYYQALQRVGSTGMSSYNPPLNEANYPGWDYVNDSYIVTDFIWETTQNSSQDEKTNAAQANAILKPLLHTITLMLEKTFPAWSYEDPSSQLVLAMNEAINEGYYDPTGKFGDLSETDPIAYKRAIAEDFAYWMIYTAWGSYSSFLPGDSPEWTIETLDEMESNTPLAYALYDDYIYRILGNPIRDLEALTFDFTQTTSN
tara:strand:+ start:1105 stop:2394 length:1290 start_codon:yes stop_codon:yes gene_type:complete